MDNSTASNNAFTHEPLPDPAKYIRLLEVLDDKYSKTIKVRCRLTTWPIDSSPPYHAISYTWGDPESNVCILMNDETLQVRTNCEFALKQAYWYRRSQSYWYRKWRSRWCEENRPEWYSQSRYFWLDAICIDQTNLGEKSKQVAMMGSIYKKASHVLACIGNHADDSLFFFRTLYGLTHYVVQAKTMFRPDRYREFRGEAANKGISLKFRMLHRYSTTHRFTISLSRLTIRPYFTRMWILQELQHARHITILCGQYLLPHDDAIELFSGVFKGLNRFDQTDNRFEVLYPPNFQHINDKFYRRLVNHGLPHPVWHGDWVSRLPRLCMATIAMLRQDYAAVKGNIFQLLNDVVSRLHCEDPRDKVYGIISLIDWADVAPLEPDYTHTDLRVAVNFIDAIIKLGEAREIGEPIWKYFSIIVKLLDLKIGSRGLVEALEARRGPLQDCASDTATMPFRHSTAQLQQSGWRLFPEDIDENISQLLNMQASPPKYPRRGALLLPRWAKADDWAIEMSTEMSADVWYDQSDRRWQSGPQYRPLIIMREEAKGQHNKLIGYGFYSHTRTWDAPSFKDADPTKIDIYFDTEDAIIYLWRMKQLYELDPNSKEWMLEFLETGVCKQHTAGSSYGILPQDPPARKERIKLTREPSPPTKSFSPLALRQLRSRLFVLWDIKDRRGWLVDGQVAALHLVLAYLKHIPQTEEFDFSRLNHLGKNTPSAAHEVLSDVENLGISVFRVLEDLDENFKRSTSSKHQASVEEKFIQDIARDIYPILLNMQSNKPFPGEYGNRSGWFQKVFEHQRGIIMKGWDFERIYLNNRAKVFAHTFDEDPGWLKFAKEVHGIFLFGCGFGEVLRPRAEYCCPYFKTLPKGQDYLAVGMHILQEFVDERTSFYDRSKTVARLSHFYAWEHGVEPFNHTHAQGDHLEQVNSSCFPIQRLVKVPHFDVSHSEKDVSLLKKSKGRLYSSQDVENLHMAGDDACKAADGTFFRDNERPPKSGMVVFGKHPDEKKLRQLAQASL